MVCYATLSELLILTRDVIDLELDVSRLKELSSSLLSLIARFTCERRV